MQHNDPPSLIYSLITKPPPLKITPSLPHPRSGIKNYLSPIKKKISKYLSKLLSFDCFSAFQFYL